MSSLPFDDATIRRARRIAENTPPTQCDPRVEALVNDLIGRVADKWTMIILETLTEHEELRFTQLGRQVPGISQKMLTQTLRQMERDGMVTRTVHPVIPPRVDYRLTELGQSLGVAFCGVWIWAEDNFGKVEAAREAFDRR
ncbi:helix-turn-helix transcriptional regulator [Sphingomonas sp. CGMCC 1.13654]|uniref:Helix-turn-helix transcriptional regulator n=1 Tax=Sphingomonas chungangi TaxID=2683589 RepID=A0A838LBM6_9SPHN|nr:helix-turn-helix domain-containing protein [Sphingomonas chungangi]MBA2936115.1 helix-turn-helix transcriptional regulator [Sphingomonas chungangi]MVW55502.1 MarR family transcriptional regulator [Sphingomonas chungangi]